LEGKNINSKGADFNIRLEMNRSLSHFLQHNYEYSYDLYSLIYHWRLSWTGAETEEATRDVVVSMGDESEIDESRFKIYRVLLDLEGKIKGFEINGLDEEESENLSEEEAVKKVKNYLAEERGIDTSTVIVSRRNKSESNSRTVYSFTLKKESDFSDEIEETFDIELSGNFITEFTHGYSVKKEFSEHIRKEERVNLIFGIIEGILWGLIVIFMIVFLIKKIKREEIEYKKGLFFGIILFIAIVFTIVTSTSDWIGRLVGGGFGGLLVGVVALLSFTVTESMVRDEWPEKLRILDAFFNFQFKIKEVGQSIIKGLFFGTLLSFMFIFLLWLSRNVSFSWLHFSRDDIRILSSFVQLGELLSSAILNAFFIVTVLLVFAATILKRYVRNDNVLYIIFVLFIIFTGLNGYILKPKYFSSIVFIPLAVCLSYLVLKEEILINYLSIFITFALVKTGSTVVLESSQLITSVDFFYVVFALLFITGLVLLYTGRNIDELGEYVPGYVSKIALKERFMKELEIARTVQQNFLPQKSPGIKGINIASLCIPAMEVGGDYYDFIEIDENRLGVVIGDVSGKGISAAFYMTMAKGIIKSLCSDSNSPSDILRKMNSIFYSNATRNVFISVIYGIFDRTKKEFVFARAGHTPIVLRKRDKEQPEFHSPNGIALGLDKGEIFSQVIEDKILEIAPGDVFIFYTDGVSEAVNEKEEEFGEERLAQIITENSDNDANKIVQIIKNKIEEFSSKSYQKDDITLVVVKIE